MARSDFSWITFDHSFTAADPDTTRTFQVQGTVVDAQPDDSMVPTEGYVLVLAHDVESSKHQIEINGKDLPSLDIPRDGNEEWQTWMDRIPSGFLQTGPNRITIRRLPSAVINVNDNFFISAVAVHWREAG